MLFLLYVAALQLLIEDCGLHPHHFADYTQIYGFCSPTPSSCMEPQSRIDVASFQLEAITQAPAQHCQNGNHLANHAVRICCHNNLLESALT